MVGRLRSASSSTFMRRRVCECVRLIRSDLHFVCTRVCVRVCVRRAAHDAFCLARLRVCVECRVRVCVCSDRITKRRRHVSYDNHTNYARLIIAIIYVALMFCWHTQKDPTGELHRAPLFGSDLAIDKARLCVCLFLHTRSRNRNPLHFDWLLYQHSTAVVRHSLTHAHNHTVNHSILTAR